MSKRNRNGGRGPRSVGRDLAGRTSMVFSCCNAACGIRGAASSHRSDGRTKRYCLISDASRLDPTPPVERLTRFQVLCDAQWNVQSGCSRRYSSPLKLPQSRRVRCGGGNQKESPALVGLGAVSVVNRSEAHIGHPGRVARDGLAGLASGRQATRLLEPHHVAARQFGAAVRKQEDEWK